jgi:hypothetical protein
MPDDERSEEEFPYAHLPLYCFNSMTNFTDTDTKLSLGEINHRHVVNK